jgi:hypothetical protein
MLNIKAQLFIAAILVSATAALAAETADQGGAPAPAAATQIAAPKADADKKPSARRQQTAEASAPAEGAATEIAPPKAEAAIVLGTAY